MSSQPSVTVGIDLGDRHSHLCALDTNSGEVLEESRVPTNPRAFQRRFAGRERMLVAIEAGTQGCETRVWIASLIGLMSTTVSYGKPAWQWTKVSW